MNNNLEVADVYPQRHRLRVAKGFAPLCPVCIIDEVEETIVALQMMDNVETVNATWAALVNGNSHHRILSRKVKLEGMKAHIRLNKSLPEAEWKETWLIHKQATLEHVNPSFGFFYLIGFSEGVPDHFYPMLDKSLGIPTLPAWKDYLWQQGLAKYLIVKNDPDHGVGLNTWHVKTEPEKWQAIIRTGLSQTKIIF